MEPLDATHTEEILTALTKDLSFVFTRIKLPDLLTTLELAVDVLSRINLVSTMDGVKECSRLLSLSKVVLSTANNTLIRSVLESLDVVIRWLPIMMVSGLDMKSSAITVSTSRPGQPTVGMLTTTKEEPEDGTSGVMETYKIYRGSG